MIFIPGPVIAALTFPGVIVHEAAHMLFCRLFGLAVLDVCFMRLGNPAGYVVHEPTERFGAAFLVGIGPFIVNTALCVVFCLPAFIPVAWPAAKRGNVLALASLPLVGVLYVANLASIVWADAFYSIGVGMGIPMLVLRWWVV